MSQEWMIDVLSDIRQYARKNGLPGLSEVLDDAILIAAGELRGRGTDAGLGDRNECETGVYHRGAEEHVYS
jgi:hypothetical protein